MGATIAAKALVILALLGAGATGIYAVANKGFGSGEQTEKTNETTAPAEAKPATANSAGASAPAGAAPGSTSTDGQQLPSPPAQAVSSGPKDAAGGQSGTPAAAPSPGASSQNTESGVAGATEGGNGPS